MYRIKKDGFTFIILVLIFGHLIGTMTHTILLFDIIKLGFMGSAEAFGVSPIINGYWMSLTLIDPIIALLLIKYRKVGVLTAFINIFINVIVNSSIQIASLSYVTVYSVCETLGNIFNGFNCTFDLLMAITISISCLSISALLMNTDMYQLKFHQEKK